MGAPTWPPCPQTFGTPRPSRGAPLSCACTPATDTGAPTWPPCPQTFGTPLPARGAPRFLASSSGAAHHGAGPLAGHARPHRGLGDCPCHGLRHASVVDGRRAVLLGELVLRHDGRQRLGGSDLHGVVHPAGPHVEHP